MEQTFTRSDIEAMINSAIASALGDIKAASGGERLKTAEGDNYRFVDSSPYGRPEQGSFSRSTRSKEERQVQEPAKTPAGEPSKTPFVPTPAPEPTIAEKRSVLGGGERQTAMGSNDPRGLSRETGGRSKETVAEQAKIAAEQAKEKAKSSQQIIEKADAKMREATGQGLSPETLQAISKTAEAMAKTYVTKEELQIELAGFLKSIGSKGGNYPLFLQLELGGNYVWGPAGGASGQTHKNIYVGGKTYAVGDRTNKILQINANGSSLWVAAIQDPMPTGSEQYDVTRNDIHLPGETAGNAT